MGKIRLLPEALAGGTQVVLLLHIHEAVAEDALGAVLARADALLADHGRIGHLGVIIVGKGDQFDAEAPLAHEVVGVEELLVGVSYFGGDGGIGHEERVDAITAVVVVLEGYLAPLLPVVVASMEGGAVLGVELVAL